VRIADRVSRLENHIRRAAKVIDVRFKTFPGGPEEITRFTRCTACGHSVQAKGDEPLRCGPCGKVLA
jgi:hypothetical protein